MNNEQIDISEDSDLIDENSELIDENSLKTDKSFSKFQLIILAFQRHKQLAKGANPRISVASLKTKNTRIAMEEVNQGLIYYKVLTES